MTTDFTSVEQQLSAEARDHLCQKLGQLDSTSADYAKNAVALMVSTLKTARPNMTQEQLSHAVHSLIHTGDTFAKLPQKARNTLLDVPADRARQLVDATEQQVAARSPWLAQKMHATRTTAASVAGNPKVQAVVAPGAAGAAALGALGGAVGMAGGALAGAAAGVIPALFTFGLSIPVGAVLGGGAGGALGSAVGATAGFVGGGVAGRLVYGYREELKHGATQVKDVTVHAADYTKTRASQVGSGVMGVARNEGVQATSATVLTAMGGALAAGASAGVAGLVMGGVAGGALGLIPAPLTFGLSIPVGAVLGGGAGGVLGSLAGGTAGLLGGGATGYGVYRSRHSIRSAASAVMGRGEDVAKPTAQGTTATVGGTGGSRL